MPAGFETYNGGGQILSSYTSRLSRVLGTATLGTGGGSFAVPGFALGAPFFQFVDANFQYTGQLPRVDLSSSGLTWGYYKDPLARIAVSIIYGVR